jgi:predicted Fe-Mo cluster-binding NifX family protein
MRIIVTAVAPDLDSGLDPRFGRAAYFLAADSETMTWEAHANPALDASGGAGSQAAQFVAGQRGKAVISGAFGPNAFQALAAAGVEMYVCGPGLSVRQAIEEYRAGRLERANGPTRPGRFG